MRNLKKLSYLSILVVAILILTGCGQKREEIKFDGEEGSIAFSLKAEKKYKISTKQEDLRTSREQAILIGDDFKIGIEFDDDYGYFFKGDWEKLKEARKNNDDYQEVKYSDIKGIQYFYGGYMRYNVILPIKENDKYYLVLTIYGAKDDEESAKTAIKNEEVLDVLNHITKIDIKNKK